MAKVIITVDTEEKTVEVSLNGNSIENVNYVSVYTPYDKDSCCSMVSIGIDEVVFDEFKKHSYITAEKDINIEKVISRTKSLDVSGIDIEKFLETFNK